MTGQVKRIVAFLLTLGLTSLLCVTMYFTDNKYNEEGLRAMDGLLLVRDGDLERHPVSHLVTGWAFFPDALLEPEEFAHGFPDEYMVYTSIGERTRFDLTGDKNDPHGGGSYFLKLSLPDEPQTYAMELPEIYSAYQLYIGDRLVLQMGDPDPAHYTPRTQNHMITFDASGETTILLAVSDYSHFYSGMVYPPSFGTPLAVNMERGLRMGISLFANTLSLLAAALSFYFGLRMKHQNAKLFSLLCVVMCVFTSYGLTHSVLALPVFPWYALEMTSGYLFSLLVILLHNRICDIDPLVRRISVGTAAVFCVAALCYGLFSPWLTVPVMQVFSTLVFGFKAAAAVYLIVTAFLSLKSRSRQAAPLFYASVVYATTFVWDRVFPSYEPILSGWFIEWGSLALVGAIGYTLWRDITTAYANNLIFAEERRLMTRQLAMQTEYAKQLQKSVDENRRLTHDFRHRLHTLEGIATRFGENNELLQYLTEDMTAATVPIYSKNFCGNVAVNALLQYYSSVMAENQIKENFRLLLPDTLTLSNVELCTVLGNLLENAVEACLRQTDGNRFIKIATTLEETLLILVVENSSDGTYQFEGGRFLSRKPGTLRFGIGLESVRHTLEQHGGTLDVYPMPEQFRVGIILPIQ